MIAILLCEKHKEAIVGFIEGLTPEVQITLVICAFALGCIVIMAIFLIVGSHRRTENLSRVMKQVPSLRGSDKPADPDKAQDI
jgi:hypothetical protein